jgi:phosphoribosyl-ATP pyrophosphohydrolase
MDENRADTPEQVIEFAPTERRRTYGPVVEEAGEAIIAKIQKAAELSNENCDRAMRLAHKLSNFAS